MNKQEYWARQEEIKADIAELLEKHRDILHPNATMEAFPEDWVDAPSEEIDQMQGAVLTGWVLVLEVWNPMAHPPASSHVKIIAPTMQSPSHSHGLAFEGSGR